ncbi:hypothetical protein [Spongiimicrobium salis]|uniref:hypothetical protein n=1 Tax=Spongiimicrobium salis TaxID=1667022 RepID=UPI00374DE5B2
MELLGRINRREIFYVKRRNNPDWKYSLPGNNWIAFIIANNEDEEMIPLAVNVCLDKNVLYVCNTGEFGSRAEDYFLEEAGWRGVQYEEKTAKEYEYGTPMFSVHKNFGEGFWFAAVVVSDEDKVMDKVVCIDFTKRKVRRHLLELIDKINADWLPSDM